MAFGEKVMLIAFGEIVKKSKTREEIFHSLERMASADGVDLGKLDETEKDNTER